MTITAARLLPLGVGSLLLVGGFTTRILRWWWILRALEPKVSLIGCFGPFLVSLAINNILPLRAGDIYRVVGFRQELGIASAQILGTLVIERLLDMWVLLAFFFIGLAAMPGPMIPHTLLRGGIVVGIVCLVLLVGLLLFPTIIEQGLIQLISIVRLRDKRPALAQKINYAVRGLFKSLTVLRSPRLSLTLVSISLISWAFEGGVFAAVIRALQTDIDFWGPWFALATGTLSTLIPSSPGYVGTFDYFTMISLVAYGANRSDAIAVAIVVHTLLWLPVTLVGGGLLATSPKLLGAQQAPKPPSVSRTSHSRPLLTDATRVSGQVVVIGAGFTGLTAAYWLAKSGIKVTVLEQDAEVGGLAGSFEVNGEPIEKFYHHWFTNDTYVMDLVSELGVADRVVYHPTRTGMYYANNFFKLSSPVDLLKFRPLSWINRFRLGLMTLRARSIKSWQPLEAITAEAWLLKMFGQQIYRVVWEPLLRGKFGLFAPEVSAVWFWNKIKLRGGSRSQDGREMLAYYRGGFAALAQALSEQIVARGGQVKTNLPATGLIIDNGKLTGVKTPTGVMAADVVIATPALPIIADLIAPHASDNYVQKLRKIDYLANVCLVLELDRSLSSTYWLNVNDANFPFVGIIEHTNLEPSQTYGGRHIVYLSKYLPKSAELYRKSEQEALEYSIPYIQKMFPDFDRSWILGFHFWKADYSQPIVVRHYSEFIPDPESPLPGFLIATMAQIYPEDRGTNYAIREGYHIAATALDTLKKQ